MSDSNVINFTCEWYRRNSADRSNRIGELALGRCEEAFLRRDWEGFAHWHRIFGRARQATNGGVGKGGARGGRAGRPACD
jgi:hypothetical protein